MQNKSGVYAYVMPLEEERTIRVGALGTFTFPAGWYVYAGTAQQGVRSRTKAHRNDTKRQRYNVDYLREYAPISEIWFTYGRRYLECQFAWALLHRMTGASFVARGLGSRDCKRCYSHLVYFERRPFPAAFRSALARMEGRPVDVLVEFVTPAADDPVALRRGEVAPLVRAYDRGRRSTERQRLAESQGESAVPIGDVARELAVSVRTLKQDVQLAEAVDRIVGNCGEEAFHVLFDPRRPQSRETIMKLSRTADTRQRYRIEGVLEGTMRSVAPQNGDFHHVYDTVAFKEVPSRLGRARGALQKLQDSLNGSHDAEVLGEVRRLLELCQKAAIRLRRFINGSPSKAKTIPPKLSKVRVSPILQSREVTGFEVGKARQVVAMIIKSVWDFPEMQTRGLVPTPRERERTLTELETILATADKILGLVEENAG